MEDRFRRRLRAIVPLFQILMVPGALFLHRVGASYIETRWLACGIVLALWVVIFSLIAAELWVSVTRIKSILCNAIFIRRDSLPARICRGAVGNLVVAGSAGIALSSILLVFSYTVIIEFYWILFGGSMLVLILSASMRKLAQSHLTPLAAATSLKLSVTVISVGVLVGGYLAMVFLGPGPPTSPASAEIYQHVAERVQHRCQFFQDVARLAALTNTFVQSFQNVAGIDRLVSVAIIAMGVSVTSMLAFVICVRRTIPRKMQVQDV